MNLARLGNKYLADTEPWKLYKTDEERVKTILYNSLQIVANLAIVAQPFLPFTTAKIFQMLNLKPCNWDKAGNSDILPSGTQMNKSALLFDQITDEQIEKQVEKLQNMHKSQTSTTVQPAKSNISFDDFCKMDIRTGTILEAEKVPKTKKLLKLSIDTGVDVRTVVSGIAEYYQPEDIIGRKVNVLINLEPREIKGILSQGMILMAENAQGQLCFVSPIDDFENGSSVK